MIRENDIWKVVDAVLNPNIVKAVEKDEGLKQFLCELLVNYMFEKYKVEINTCINIINTYRIHYTQTSIQRK